MARKAITIGRRHGKDVWELIAGPERPIREHMKALKTRRAERADKTWAEIQVWTNSGARGRKYLTPAQLAKAATVQESERIAAEKRAKKETQQTEPEAHIAKE